MLAIGTLQLLFFFFGKNQLDFQMTDLCRRMLQNLIFMRYKLVPLNRFAVIKSKK